MDKFSVPIIITAGMAVLFMIINQASHEYQINPDRDTFSIICLDGYEYWHNKQHYMRALTPAISDIDNDGKGDFVPCEEDIRG